MTTAENSSRVTGKVPVMADAATLRRIIIVSLQQLQRAANDALDRIHQGKAPAVIASVEAAEVVEELSRLVEDTIVLCWRIS